MSTEKRRESPAGFHYYSTYVDCPRKAYLKYILGLKHKYTGKALLFGGAIHEALALYYQKATRGDLPLAIERFEADLDSRKDEYEKPDDFVADLQRGPLMLAEYHKTWNLEDPKRYEILEVETPYEIWIGPEKEFRVTVRPDRVVRDLDTGLIYPQETKTTSWSVGGIFGNTVDSDQVTAYIWALSKTRPEWHVDRCLIDILYKRGQVIICDRPGFGVRTQEELILFEMEMYGTILEFTQKY